MKTISVSKLKAHLSAELKNVQAGEQLTVLDHKRPVAVLSPLMEEPLFAQECSAPYTCRELQPLTTADPLTALKTERGDR